MQPLQYILLVGAVVIVGAFVMPKRKQESALSAPQSVQNMETALEQFMENMEKDNEELVKLVASAQQASNQEATKKDERIAALEKRCEHLEEQLRTTVSHLSSVASARSQTSLPLEKMTALSLSETKLTQDSTIAQIDSESINARYPELFQLYGAGKSIEVIAKKLGMNKGEVSLIIGLAKQEGTLHV
ncbi:DUF6115 domain-containing protein [Paenibacillus sp. L3-i20]|uniref:DUF6115 domain-containing protein n=1 Tax=Paenibacillus sp. L3-i20 TaxID=2905833 RepID=UPI001EDD1652|nr:hypothetical protein [Paenibacillus sp. L3-i20]GKU78654.1 hypothetical protein L3i20_v230510 [Paenibacillus sp. L3-i20]